MTKRNANSVDRTQDLQISCRLIFLQSGALPTELSPLFIFLKLFVLFSISMTVFAIWLPKVLNSFYYHVLMFFYLNIIF